MDVVINSPKCVNNTHKKKKRDRKKRRREIDIYSVLIKFVITSFLLVLYFSFSDNDHVGYYRS